MKKNVELYLKRVTYSRHSTGNTSNGSCLESSTHTFCIL